MGWHGWRWHPVPSLRLIRFTLPSHPILLPSPETVPLALLCFPALTLFLHPRPFLLSFLVPFLALDKPNSFVLFLLLAIKGLALGIVSASTECTGHLVQLGFFSSSNGVRVG